MATHRVIVLARNRPPSKPGALSQCRHPGVRGLGAPRLLRLSRLLGPLYAFATNAIADSAPDAFPGNVSMPAGDHGNAASNNGRPAGPPSATVPSMAAHTFNVVYEDAGDGWVYAHVPELPEVHTQGENLDQAREMIRDAITLVLDERRARGEAIPRTFGSRHGSSRGPGPPGDRL